VEEGSAYYCFCTPERLTEMRKQQEELKLPMKYDEHCRNVSLEESLPRIEA
jgi:glutamyl/glutaminyl-tRNA synthetase